MNPQIVYSNPAPQPCPTGPLPLSQIPGFFTSSCGLLNQSNANINDCSSISNSSNNLVSSATCLTASGLPHIATASPLSAPQLATFSPSMPPTSTPIVVASSTSDPTHLSTSGWPISGHEVPGLVPHQSPHSPQPQLAGVGTVPSLHISTALPSALTTTTISASVTPDFVPNLSTISSSTQASLMPFHGTHQPVSIVSATQSSEFSNGPVSNTSTISPTCRTMLVPSTRRWRSGTSIQLVSPNSPILTQTSTPISTGIVYGTTESATALASTCVSTSFATVITSSSPCADSCVDNKNFRPLSDSLIHQDKPVNSHLITVADIRRKWQTSRLLKQSGHPKASLTLNIAANPSPDQQSESSRFPLEAKMNPKISASLASDFLSIHSNSPSAQNLCPVSPASISESPDEATKPVLIESSTTVHNSESMPSSDPWLNFTSVSLPAPTSIVNSMDIPANVVNSPDSVSKSSTSHLVSPDSPKNSEVLSRLPGSQLFSQEPIPRLYTSSAHNSSGHSFPSPSSNSPSTSSSSTSSSLSDREDEDYDGEGDDDEDDSEKFETKGSVNSGSARCTRSTECQAADLRPAIHAKNSKSLSSSNPENSTGSLQSKLDEFGRLNVVKSRSRHPSGESTCSGSSRKASSLDGDSHPSCRAPIASTSKKTNRDLDANLQLKSPLMHDDRLQLPNMVRTRYCGRYLRRTREGRHHKKSSRLRFDGDDDKDKENHMVHVSTSALDAKRVLPWCTLSEPNRHHIETEITPLIHYGPGERLLLAHCVDGYVIYESNQPFPVKNAMSLVEACLKQSTPISDSSYSEASSKQINNSETSLKNSRGDFISKGNRQPSGDNLQDEQKLRPQSCVNDQHPPTYTSASIILTADGPSPQLSDNLPCETRLLSSTPFEIEDDQTQNRLHSYNRATPVAPSGLPFSPPMSNTSGEEPLTHSSGKDGQASASFPRPIVATSQSSDLEPPFHGDANSPPSVSHDDKQVALGLGKKTKSQKHIRRREHKRSRSRSRTLGSPVPEDRSSSGDSEKQGADYTTSSASRDSLSSIGNINSIRSDSPKNVDLEAKLVLQNPTVSVNSSQSIESSSSDLLFAKPSLFEPAKSVPVQPIPLAPGHLASQPSPSPLSSSNLTAVSTKANVQLHSTTSTSFSTCTSEPIFRSLDQHSLRPPPLVDSAGYRISRMITPLSQASRPLQLGSLCGMTPGCSGPCPPGMLGSSHPQATVLMTSSASLPPGPIASWSVGDVATFVSNTPGCVAYAAAFLTNEIDGEALLLLAEDQFIVPPIGMKVGPALKLSARLEEVRRDQDRAHI